jgi:LysR family nitrogen assimilation transcriptional regulator
MDLRQIQYFVALFEERSVTKAARRLNVVQPAISMQIGRLEKTFKTKLFERTSRGVTPTEIGRSYYGLCQKILADVHEARRYLQEASGRISGELTIGLMPSVANSVLPQVLASYKDAYPEVTLRIVESYSGSLMDALLSGRLDLAVVNNMGNFVGVAISPLFKDHLVLVTRYAAGSKAPVDIPAHRLQELRLVLPSQRQGMRVLIDSMLASSGIVLKPEIELDSLGPTLDLVRKSDWATILPVIAVKQAADRKLLRQQRIINPTIPRQVVVASPSNRMPSLAGQIFAKFLQDRIKLILDE